MAGLALTGMLRTLKLTMAAAIVNVLALLSLSGFGFFKNLTFFM